MVLRKTGLRGPHQLRTNTSTHSIWRSLGLIAVALAGQFPGTTPNQADFPLFMNVDYVRVWQKP